MKNLVRCLLVLEMIFSALSARAENEAGPILVFYGPSTSGKTSLINAIKKSYTKPIKEFGLDLQIAKMLRQLEDSNYKKEFLRATQVFSRGEVFTALVRKEVDILRNHTITILKIELGIELIKQHAHLKGITLTESEISAIEALKVLIEHSHSIFSIEALNYKKVFIEMFKEMILQ